MAVAACEIFGIFENLREIFGAFSGTFGNSWEIFGEPSGIFQKWPENGVFERGVRNSKWGMVLSDAPAGWGACPEY
jgi:hypothetical protein